MYVKKNKKPGKTRKKTRNPTFEKYKNPETRKKKPD